MALANDTSMIMMMTTMSMHEVNALVAAEKMESRNALFSTFSAIVFFCDIANGAVETKVICMSIFAFYGTESNVNEYMCDSVSASPICDFMSSSCSV